MLVQPGTFGVFQVKLWHLIECKLCLVNRGSQSSYFLPFKVKTYLRWFLLFHIVSSKQNSQSTQQCGEGSGKQNKTKQHCSLFLWLCDSQAKPSCRPSRFLAQNSQGRAEPAGRQLGLCTASEGSSESPYHQCGWANRRCCGLRPLCCTLLGAPGSFQRLPRLPASMCRVSVARACHKLATLISCSLHPRASVWSRCNSPASSPMHPLLCLCPLPNPLFFLHFPRF